MPVDCAPPRNLGVEVNEVVSKSVCKPVYDCHGSYKSGTAVPKNVPYGCMSPIASVGG